MISNIGKLLFVISSIFFTVFLFYDVYAHEGPIGHFKLGVDKEGGHLYLDEYNEPDVDVKINNIFWDNETLVCDFNNRCLIAVYLDPDIGGVNIFGDPDKKNGVAGDEIGFSEIKSELNKALITVNSITDNLSFVLIDDPDLTPNRIIASPIAIQGIGLTNAPGFYSYLSFHQNNNINPIQFEIKINTQLGRVESNPLLIKEFHTFEECGNANNADPYLDIEKTFNHELFHVFAVPHSSEKESLAPHAGYFCGPQFGYTPTVHDVEYVQHKYPDLSIPSWLKFNAEWWSDSKIKDYEFLNAINYLLKEGIMTIDAKNQDTTQKTGSVPSWVKNNAGWWSDGSIDTPTFTTSLKWLIDNGYIQLGSFILDQIPTRSILSESIVTAENTITMAGNAENPACKPNCFSPSKLTIISGDSVTFVNSKSSPTVIASGNDVSGPDGKFNSGPIGSGLSYTRTFDISGIYNYYDRISPWMQGIIIVGSTDTNNPPTANAGSDQTINENTTVVLSGIGTDPENGVIYYTWKQTSGHTVSLSGSNYPGGASNSQFSSFTAPQVSADTTLTFELKVKDDIQQSDTDTVVITIKNTDATPNRPPTANAGPDQTVNESITVTLDGSGSSDPDGDTLTYTWEQKNGTPVSLDTATIQSPTFTAPDINAGSTSLVFKLIVRDSNGVSGYSDYVTITVNDVPEPPNPTNTRPISNAGSDQTVIEQTTVTLDGTASYDPNGDTITYRWTQLLSSGDPVISLSDPNVSSPTFAAPDISSQTLLEFTLIVNDGQLDSLVDVVQIIAIPVVVGPSPNLPYIPNPDSTRKAEFGYSVAANDDNNVLVVGAPNKDIIVLSTGAAESIAKSITESITAGNSSSSNNIIGSNSISNFNSETLSFLIHNQTNSAHLIDTSTGDVLLDIETVFYYDTELSSSSSQDEEKPSDELIMSHATSGYVLAVSENDMYLYHLSPPQLSPPPPSSLAEQQPTIPSEAIITSIASTHLYAGGFYILHGDTGAKLHAIDNPTPGSSDYFGFSVATNNNLIAVSTPGNGGSGTVYLYDYSGRLLHTINNPTPATSDDFGHTVFLTGSQLIVGTPSNDNESLFNDLNNEGVNTGGVYIYSHSGSLLKAIVPAAGQDLDFGYSVSATSNGEKILIGAPGDNFGTVYVYDSSGNLLKTIPNPTPSYDHAQFGRTVVSHGSSNNNSNYVTVGAPLFENDAGIRAGTAFVYDVVTGDQIHKIDNPEPDSSDNFGYAVVPVDNSLLAISSHQDTVNGASRAGTVYLFNSTDVSHPLYNTLENPDPDSREYFGASLGTLGSSLIVGMPEDAQYISDAGAIYLFSESDYTPVVPTVPTADAGVDQSANDGDTVTLDGTASSDPNNDSLFYLWSQTDGTRYVMDLSDAEVESPTFTVPHVTANTTLQFSLVVNDGEQNSMPDTVSIAITNTNDSPVGNADTATTAEDKPVTILVLNNDSDADGDALSVHSVNNSSTAGVASINGTDDNNNTIIFTPSDNYHGDTSFSYVVSDGNGGLSNSTDVLVIITPVNDVPLAIDDGPVMTLEDNNIVIDVLGNDSDADIAVVVNTSSSSSSSITSSSNIASSLPAVPSKGFYNNENTYIAYYDGMTQIPVHYDAITSTIPGMASSPKTNDDANSQILTNLDQKISVYQSQLEHVKSKLDATKDTYDSQKEFFQDAKEKLAEYKRQYKDGTITEQQLDSQKESFRDVKESFSESRDVWRDTKNNVKQQQSEIKQKISELLKQRSTMMMTHQSNNGNNIDNDDDSNNDNNSPPTAPQQKEIKKQLQLQRESFKIIKEKFQLQKELWNTSKENFNNLKSEFADYKKQYNADDNTAITQQQFKSSQNDFKLQKKLFQEQKQSWIAAKEQFQKEKAMLKISKGIWDSFDGIQNTIKSSYLSSSSSSPTSPSPTSPSPVQSGLAFTDTPKIPIHLTLYQNYTDSINDDDVLNGINIIVSGATGDVNRNSGGNDTTTTNTNVSAIAMLSESEVSLLAESDLVQYMELPHIPVLYDNGDTAAATTTTTITSQGVSASAADLFHAKNVTGNTVTVAVIDDSFILTDPEISQNIAYSALYDSSGKCGGTISCGNTNATGTSHGTAVSQIIVDMAPDISLEVYAISNSVDFANAINDILIRGTADVVSVSLGFPTAGGSDGDTGHFRDGTSSVAKTVNRLKSAGIIPVIAAGNDANRHWMGTYAPSSTVSPGSLGLPSSSYQSVMEFQPDKSGLQKACLPISSGTATIASWNAWPLTTQDYDIILYNHDLTGYYAFSARQQSEVDGGLSPIELIQSGGVSGCLVVASRNSTQDHTFHITAVGGFVNSGLAVPAGSVSTPADAAGATTVGAINYSTEELESFSSNGPTDDGRTKPEICGHDGVASSQSEINPFYGTSSAAPHVAGAMSLLLQAYPDVNADTVISLITSDGSSGSGGDTNNNNNNNNYSENQCGTGRGSLHLGALAANYNPTTPTINPAPAGDSIRVISASEPSHGTSTILNNGTILYSPDSDYYGADTFEYFISDESNAVSVAAATVNIEITPVNDTPYITPIIDYTINPGDELSFTAIVVDADISDIHIFTLSDTAPAGAIINGTTGFFSWITDDSHADSSYTFAVLVADNGTPSSLSDDELLTVTVLPKPDAPPVIDAIGDVIINEGEDKIITVNATDADGDAITYSLIQNTTSSSSSFASIINHTITLSPTYDDAGVHSVTVNATSNDLSDTESFGVTVSNVDRSPTIAPINDVTINEGQTQMILVNATDADGDAITYFLTQNTPSFATIANHTITLSPTFTDSGNHTIAVNVTAGSKSDDTSFAVTVNDVDITPPVIALIGANPQVIELGDEYTELGAVTDDGSPVTINATAFEDALGSYSITYDSTDTSGNKAIQVIRTVNILDTTAPAIITPDDVTAEATAVLTTIPIQNATATDASSSSLFSSPIIITNNATEYIADGFPLGTTAINWVATDTSGNTANATQTVTITDTTVPSIVSPTDKSFEATAINTPLTELDYGTATASDIFAPVTITNNATATFPLNNTAILWTATDANGLNATAIQIITITDTTAPSITPPAAFTVEATALNTPLTSSDYGTATATDIFNSVVITNNATATFPLGDTTILWTATDANGLNTTATQTVTITDTTAPSITPPPAYTAEAIAINTPLTELDYGTATATDIFNPVVITNNATATFPLGTTTIAYTATDANGLNSTTTQDITITDTTIPSITPPIAYTAEATDVLSILTQDDYGTATATDIFGSTITSDAPTTFPLGNTTINWTATDTNGLNATATQTVTLTDTTTPTITTPTDQLFEATAVNTPLTELDYGTAIATDIFNPITITNNATVTFPLNNTTILWTATDANGLNATATQIITITDTTTPTINTPAAFTAEATAVNTPLTELDYGTATASDIFGSTITSDAPITFPLGNTTINWTATDGTGLNTTATQIITITDTTTPTINTPTDQLFEATAVLSTLTQDDYGTAIATDIFNPITITNNATVTFPLGNTTILWTATDGTGLNTTATQTVTLTDTTIPSIISPTAFTAEATAINTPLTELDYGTAIATDIFNPVTITSNATATFPLGTTTIAYTATDANGLNVTATQDITITDTTTPIITPPPTHTAEATAVNTPLTSLDYGTAIATDIFDPVTITSNATATFPLGTTTIAYTATDANGLNVTATQDITITDTTVPTITAPADVSFEATAVSTPLTSSDYGTATASDIFNPVVITSDAPSDFPLGDTTILWTATDANGLNVTATQDITITDTTTPIITPPPTHTAEATDILSILTQDDYGTAIATDIFGSTITSDAPITFPLGNTTINWTATDDNGLNTTATQTVTLTDTTTPTITAPTDQSFEATAINTPLTELDYGTSIATDIFAPVTITSNATATFNLGDTVILWTATDTNGLNTTATQIVTLIDTTFPTITPPPVYIAEATAINTPLTSLDYGTATATDIFDPVTITSNATATFPLGNTTILWTATDGNGLNTTATQIVTLIDTTIPSIISPTAFTAEATAINTPLTELDYGTATATDIFAPVTITSNATATFPLGTTTIAYTATDGNGLTNSTIQTITVTDTTAPVITILGDNPQTVEAYISAYSDAGATAHDNIDGNVTQSVIITTNPVNSTVIDTYTVEYFVSDLSGNNASASRIVTVQDTTAPAIITPDDVMAEATAVLTAIQIQNATATDASLSSSPIIITNNATEYIADGFPLGTTGINWVATDASNNTSNTTQTVIVQDTTPPVISLLGNATVSVQYNSAYSDAGATAADIYDGNLTDSITTINPVNTSFAGNYTITYDVTDSSNNDALQNLRIVTVLPKIDVPPVIDAIDDVIINESQTRFITVNATDLDGDTIAYFLTQNTPSFVNMTNDTITISPTFTDAGDYSVTVNATSNGLSDDTSFNVTVSNVDRSPTITPINNVIIDEGDTEILTVNATDPDGDTITYLLTQNTPSFAILTNDTITLSPAFTDSGNYTATVNATANGKYASTSFAITVNDDDDVTRVTMPIDPTKWAGTKTVTVSHEMVSGDDSLEDFPLLVSFTDESLQSARTDGADLTFTNIANYTIPFEIESWDNTTGTIVSWVNIPVLSASEDTVILLHYDNPLQLTSLATPEAVWSNNDYLAVYHMSDATAATATTDDSTIHNNDGANSGATSIQGKISNSQDFDGANDRVILPNDKGLNLSGDTMTISAWVNADVTDGTHTILGKSYDSSHSSPYYEWLLFQAQDRYHTRASFTAFDTAAGTVTANTWQYVTTTYDGIDLTLYVNGILESSTPKTNLLQQSDQSPTIGGRNTPDDTNPNAESFDGQIDEVRISNVTKSAHWIATEYTNQNDPNSFHTITPAPILPDVIAPVITLTGENPQTISLGAGYTELGAVTDDGSAVTIDSSAFADIVGSYSILYDSVDTSGNHAIQITRTIHVTDLSSYAGTKTITINHDKISGDDSLIDYPLLVSFTDIPLQSARADGADITFTDTENNVLPFEIESWNSTTGSIVSWVNVPVLSATANTNTTVLLHYDNPLQLTSLAAPESVWSKSSYEAVYHMNQNVFGVTNDTADSTSSQLHGTTMGAMNVVSNSIPSKIGQGLDFDGNDDFIDLPDFTSDTFKNNHTISAWVNYDTLNHWSRIIDFSAGGSANDNILIANQGTTQNLAYEVYVGSTGGNKLVSADAIDRDTWMHVTVTHDGNTNQAIMYKDGIPIQSGTVHDVSDVTRTTNYIAKSNWDNDGYFDGTMDELRISSDTKTAHYIKTQHANQNDPGSFYVITPAPVIPDVISPVITLNGNNPQTIQLGDGYTDLGATTDDGSTVNIDATAFTDAIGSYPIYYDSVDSSGNAAIKVTRTVHVVDLSSSANTKVITINPDHVSGTENMTNYPLLVSFADVSLQSARADGADMIFTDTNNNVLPFEIESWDNTTGTIVSWVNIPTLSASEDTVILLHYNNPSQTVSLAEPSDVWYNDAFVAHFAEIATDGGGGGDDNNNNNTSISDSTIHNAAATDHGTTSVDVSAGGGKIGDARSFDGTSWIDYDDSVLPSSDNPRTISLWANPDTLNPGWHGIVAYGTPAGNGTPAGSVFGLFHNGNNLWGGGYGDDVNTNHQLNTDQWSKLDMTYDGSTVITYVNGEQTATDDTKNWETILEQFRIGRQVNTAPEYFTGLIDEARISHIAKSADYLKTEYTNQNDPGSFYSITPTPIIPDVISPVITLTGENPQTIQLGNPYTDLGAVTDDGSAVTIDSSAFADIVGSYSILYDSVDSSGNHAIQITRTVHVVDLSSSANTKVITINPDHVSGTENMINYPLLVSFADIPLQSARADGADITFTDTENNVLPFEIESWDNTTGSIVSWVNIPILSASNNTVIYLHYNNPSQTVSLADPESVWGNNDYLAVYHMSDVDDSTIHNNDGILSGTTGNVAAGKISNSQNFDGANDRVILPNDKGLNLSGDTMTISAWVNADVTDGTHTILGKSYDSSHSSPYYEWLLFQAQDRYHTRASFTAFDTAAGTVTANTWQYITATYDGIDLTLYVNGILESSVPKTGPILQSDQSPTIGGRNTPDNTNPNAESFDGQIDEVRISNVAKSAHWIQTEWNNQNDPGSFYTVETVLP